MIDIKKIEEIHDVKQALHVLYNELMLTDDHVLTLVRILEEQLVAIDNGEPFRAFGALPIATQNMIEDVAGYLISSVGIRK